MIDKVVGARLQNDFRRSRAEQEHEHEQVGEGLGQRCLKVRPLVCGQTARSHKQSGPAFQQLFLYQASLISPRRWTASHSNLDSQSQP